MAPDNGDPAGNGGFGSVAARHPTRKARAGSIASARRAGTDPATFITVAAVLAAVAALAAAVPARRALAIEPARALRVG